MTLTKLFLETYPKIKFEDGSVKQNILIACTGLALAPFSCLKWPIQKNQGRFHGRRTVYFLCVFVRNGEWRGFFSYLRHNLLVRDA